MTYANDLAPNAVNPGGRELEDFSLSMLGGFRTTGGAGYESKTSLERAWLEAWQRQQWEQRYGHVGKAPVRGFGVSFDGTEERDTNAPVYPEPGYTDKIPYV
jgi:hypothetical protein